MFVDTLENSDIEFGEFEDLQTGQVFGRHESDDEVESDIESSSADSIDNDMIKVKVLRTKKLVCVIFYLSFILLILSLYI